MNVQPSASSLPGPTSGPRARAQGPGRAGRSWRPIRVRRRRRNLGAATLLVAVAGGFAWQVGTSAGVVLLAAGVLAWLLTPAMARLARRVDAVVMPGGRMAHARPTPLAGGLALVLPVVLVAGMQLLGGAQPMAGLLLAALMLVGVGLADDVRGVGPRKRLAVQALAGVVLAASGWSLEALSLGSGRELLLEGTWLAHGLLVLWVVCCVNAFNLVDGMDGLCASLALVAAGGGLLAGANPLLCAVTAGGSVGFLRHNAPGRNAPRGARVFLGDAGSQLLGLLVACIALSLPRQQNLVLALALVAYPAGDVAVTILRRMLRAKPLFAGDRSHVHHKVRDLCGSTHATLLVLAGFAMLHVGAGLVLGGARAVALGLAAWALLVGVLLWASRRTLPHMLHNRRSFRRLHATRAYVADLLDIAATPEDVRSALLRLYDDLGLVRLELDRLGTVAESGIPREGAVAVDLALRRGKAQWTFVRDTIDPALEREVRTVVSELLARAHDRLLQAEDKHDALQPA